MQSKNEKETVLATPAPFNFVHFSDYRLFHGVPLAHPLLSTRKTFCDPFDKRYTTATPAVLSYENMEERAKIQGEINRLQNESCASCLWTGVATCAGLAVYFAHAAYEIDKAKLTAVAKQQQRYNKPAFMAISVGWLGIGAYRWYLG